jgi:hypothetical protein
MTGGEKIPNVPPRELRVMKAQPIVAWTPVLLVRALGAWLMEEEPYRPLAGTGTANPERPQRR